MNGIKLQAKCAFCHQLIGFGDLATFGKPKRNCHTECFMEHQTKKI